jgi:hypothetical protein
VERQATVTSLRQAEVEQEMAGNINRVEWKTAGTYSWRVPPGVTNITVLVVGGGGGGGNGIGASNNPAQGGKSGKVNTRVLSVTPGQSIQVVVGAGGSGTWVQSSAGSRGGNSSFGEVSAEGGLPGQRAFNLDGSGNASASAGQTGGTSNGVGEDTILPDGTKIGSGGKLVIGSWMLCADNSVMDGKNATGNGAGGGGLDVDNNCARSGTNKAEPSGNGAPGLVRVTWV